MADYSSGQGVTTTPSGAFGGQSVDNIRRTFGISDKVAQLAPAESLFFSYLSKLGKKPTDETVWKPLEYRNQWQRRNFKMQQVKITGTLGDDNVTFATGTNSANGDHIAFECDYNYQGKKLQSYTSLGTSATGGYSPIFLTARQI